MKTIAKALTAGAVALVGAFGTALSDGDLTAPECLVSVGVGLLAAAATYQVPNTSEA